MSKNISLGLAILALMVLGVWFFISRNGPESAGNNENKSASVSEKRSMRELIAQGSSQKCSFRDSSQNMDSSGTVYFSGGRMRADFENVTEGKRVVSHMIVADNTGYIWTSEDPQGMKMMMDAGANTLAGRQSPVDYDSKLDYDCSGWSGDTRMFELPTGVSFVDLNAMMKNLQGTPAGQ